jgi:ADP-ribosyl-[dinitrogen reductase] hydrolase
MSQLERYEGSLLGLAVGDAIGTSLEFMAPGTFEPITDMIGGGFFGLEPGQWTDDTSMALCLAESLTEKKSFDPADQMERYLNWFNNGHMSSTGELFDIGTTTRRALTEFEKSREPFCGPTDEMSAGNGSIMRLAPVVLFYGNKPEEALEKAAESSRTTHGSRIAVDACRYLAALIYGALNGASKEELLADFYSPVPGYWEKNPPVYEIAEIADGSFRKKQPPEISAGGFAPRTLEAALWAFYHTNSFRDGCLKAVNLGDDADTVGSVYGQLAGAFYGSTGIPREWREKLVSHDMIVAFAHKLYDLSEN